MDLDISKIAQAIYHSEQKRPTTVDADQALYDGFMNNTDKRISEQIHTLSVEALKDFHPKFKDKKLSQLLLHFKARNYPESLTQDEQEDWFEIVQSRVQAGENGYLSIDNYSECIDALRQTYPDKESLWQQLEEYAASFL